MSKLLKNKPLVEAIFEMRWELQGKPPGPQIDPHYKLLLGRLYDRMLDEYPEHEQLQTASVPDEIVGHIVQHRFRTKPGGWPLIQIGPGILTVNSTNEYTWDDFRSRVLVSVSKFFDAHPKESDLKITNLLLRYIDAVNFDFKNNNVFNFLNDKLKLSVSLPNNLFIGTGIENKPNSFTWQSSFDCQIPKGLVNIRFATAQKNNIPAVVWETIVESIGEDLPEMPKSFDAWLDSAHDITDDWFFKMIEGELQRSFSGE